MSFFKKLFGGGEKPASKSTHEFVLNNAPKDRKPTIQDLFFTEFATIEKGEHDLLTKEFELFDEVEVIMWTDYPKSKNVIFSGKYSKRNLSPITKLVNSLAYFYGKDAHKNDIFNADDEYSLLDKGSKDLAGWWWIGRSWDTSVKHEGLPGAMISRDDDNIRLTFYFNDYQNLQ